MIGLSYCNTSVTIFIDKLRWWNALELSTINYLELVNEGCRSFLKGLNLGVRCRNPSYLHLPGRRLVHII